MIRPPVGIGAFEFVVLATLRANQLTRGCRSRVEPHSLTAVTAQLEVAGGFIVRMPPVVGAGKLDDVRNSDLIAIAPSLAND